MSTITWSSAASNNVVFGAGRIFWLPEQSDGSLNRQAGEIYLGDTPGFSLGMEGDIATVESSDGPSPEVIATAPQTASRSFEFECLNISPENFARFIVGETSTVTQAAVAVVDEDLAAVQGRFYQLGQSASNPVGHYGGVGSVAIAEDGGGSAKVLGTDYEIDTDTGLLRWITASDAVEIDYTPTAGTRTRVTSSDTGDQYGQLTFRADNARGDNVIMVAPKVLLQGSGQAAMKSRSEPVRLAFTATLDKRSGYAQLYIDGRPAS